MAKVLLNDYFPRVLTGYCWEHKEKLKLSSKSLHCLWNWNETTLVPGWHKKTMTQQTKRYRKYLICNVDPVAYLKLLIKHKLCMSELFLNGFGSWHSTRNWCMEIVMIDMEPWRYWNTSSRALQMIRCSSPSNTSEGHTRNHRRIFKSIMIMNQNASGTRMHLATSLYHYRL